MKDRDFNFFINISGKTHQIPKQRTFGYVLAILSESKVKLHNLLLFDHYLDIQSFVNIN